MDRQSSIDKHSGGLPLVAELTTALVALLVAVQTLAAVALFARRLSGAMTAAAAPGWLLVWLLVAALVAAATRVLWFARRAQRGFAGDATVLYVPLVAIALTAAAFTSVGALVLVTAAAWLIAVAEESATLLLVAARYGKESFAGGMRLGGRLPRRFGDRAPKAPQSETPLLRPAGALDRHAQKIERVQAADGRDMLSGSLTTCFVPGQARAAIHVAFCPPFALVPRLDYRQVAGPAAGIKVGQLLPHGARLELKLDRAAETPVQVVLDVRATCENRADDRTGPDAQARI